MKLKNTYSILKSTRTIGLAAGIGMALGVLSPTVLAADTSAPSAMITATDQGACGNAKSWYSMNIATQLAEVKDNTGVTKVEFYIDGKIIGTNTKSGNEYGMYKSCAGLSNGPHSLTVKLYDAAGNVGIAKTYSGANKLSFTVSNDNTAPTGELFVYKNAENSYSANVINIKDDFGATSVVYYIDGAKYMVTPPDDMGLVDITGYGVGRHYVEARILDEAANEGKAIVQDGSTKAPFIITGVNAPTDNQATPMNDPEKCVVPEKLVAATERIYNRAESNTEATDKIINKIISYITTTKGGMDISDELADVQQKATAADFALVQLAQQSIFSCDQPTKTQVTEFKTGITEYQKSLKEYRQSAIELINATREDNN